MTLHRGKLATNPDILEVRPLTRDDLACLPEVRGPHPDRAGSGHIQRLRDPHHRLARLVAAGLRNDEIVARSGFSTSRLLTIRKDPAFIELVATYRDKVDAAFEREAEAWMEQATSNMLTAERMLAERLEIHDEEGTLPSIRELMSIRADSADRLGYGKKQTNLNVNVDLAAQLEKAHARMRAAREVSGVVALPLTPVQDVGAPAALPAPAAFRRRA